jgi:hypothetical protein
VTGTWPADGRLCALLAGLGRAQGRRPRLFLWLGLAVSLVAALLCTRLTLRIRFEDLLPERSPSVIELHRLLRETERGGQIYARMMRVRRLAVKLVNAILRARRWRTPARQIAGVVCSALASFS